MSKKRIFLLVVLALAVIACSITVYVKESKVVPDDPKKTYISAYEKLADGAPIDILIVGDSIAAGTGATSGNSWAALLPKSIEEKYGSSCNIVNVSMGGNTSIAGTLRVKMLDEDTDFDLALICYGENDIDDETFALNYESIIRSIKSKYGNCSIISILESSQRDYTNKINQIIDIANFYGIPVVDTIKAYESSGYEYEELVNAPDDLTHPNNFGHAIYLSSVLDVIYEQVRSRSAYVGTANPNDDLIYIPRSLFLRTGLTTFEIQMNPLRANIGIYRSHIPGTNTVEIYSDDKQVFEQQFEWEYPFGQEHVEQLTSEPVELGETLTVKFASVEEAKYFKGLFLIVE